jgi:hypothetical protein
MQSKNMIHVRKWFNQNFIFITYKNKGYDQKKVLKTSVEQIKGNGRSFPYLYPIGHLT